uniref:Uncharacterized protein n=1 Tax=Glossina pallidipes TaxID=7398 RepID=A0A1B0AK49_GLOPL
MFVDVDGDDGVMLAGLYVALLETTITKGTNPTNAFLVCQLYEVTKQEAKTLKLLNNLQHFVSGILPINCGIEVGKTACFMPCYHAFDQQRSSALESWPLRHATVFATSQMKPPLMPPIALSQCLLAAKLVGMCE